MPRRKRSYLPDGAFHITARTHSGEFWFEDLRSEIVGIIAFALNQTHAELLAYAIMTNHIHLVLRQGNAPLSDLMHPVGQRVAYAVHRRLGRKGYVMGYRYFDTPCNEPSHLRNAIMYTHRNPVAADICKEAWNYEWSSDMAYRSAAPAAQSIIKLRPAIGLFTSGIADRTPQQDYADFYSWYDACKKLGPDDPRPHMPGVTADDEYWMQHFGSTPTAVRCSRTDLRDDVRRALAELAPNYTMDQLRAGGQSKSIHEIRSAIIERALGAGHRPFRIARFLHTSDSTVSRVRAALARDATI